MRILTTIDQGQTPFAVNAVYVFGSYARGALNPNDVDLLVVHEPIPEAMLAKWTRYYYDEHVLPSWRAKQKAFYRCLASLGKAIRRPGERIDIIYDTDADRALSALLGRGDAKLLWSTTERDWSVRLAALRPDASAGTAPRAHIVSVKRIVDDRECIEKITDAIAHDELLLTRIPIDHLPSRLAVRNCELLAHWQRVEAVGRQSMKLLPYALSYLQTLRQQADYIHGGELSVWSTSGSTLIQLGKPRLWHAVYYLRRSSKLKRVAFLLHLKRDEPNEVLVFERGLNWKTEQMDERARLREPS